MVKFRTLGGEAVDKGFDLPAMELTFDLPLSMSFIGFEITDCTVPIGQPIKPLDQ